MIDLKSESTRKELRRAMQLSEKVREEFNTRRALLIQKTLGDNWNTEGKKATITSLLYRAYETFSFDLSISRPRCSITARNQELAGFARHFGLAVNNYARQIRFADELMAGIMDAMFGMAVFKRYWGPTNTAREVLNIEIEEPGPGATPHEWKEYKTRQYLRVDPGQPMIERLCPEDWVYDTAMPRRRQFRFEAHRYRRAISDIKVDRRFDRQARQQVQPRGKFGNTKNHAQELSQQGFTHDPDELEPMATLWDVWLPESQTFATLAEDGSLPPLALGPWNGAPGGPFTPLIFSSLPDNFEPVSMLGNLEASHDIVNSLMRKMNMQARRQKDVTAYSGPEADAIRVRDGNDGDLVRVMSPEAIQVLKSAGVNPSIGQFASIMQQIGNKEGGNLDLIAGVAQQSDTATQDQMLNARSSAMQSKRMQRVAEVAGELYEALAWMMWHDVTLEVPGHIDVPMRLGDIRVDSSWQPDDRMGELEDYQFSYTPYNEAYMSPQQKAQLVNGLITNFYVPLLPIMQQSGQTLDFKTMAQFHEDMLNVPEIKQFITDMPPPPDDMGGMGMGSGMPPEQGMALGEAPKMPGANRYIHENVTRDPVSDRPENAWAEVGAMEE